MLGHPVVLEHVEQGGLASVVEPKEQKLARLLPEAQVAQGTGE